MDASGRFATTGKELCKKNGKLPLQELRFYQRHTGPALVRVMGCIPVQCIIGRRCTFALGIYCVRCPALLLGPLTVIGQ